jgi:hypothetical protein
VLLYREQIGSIYAPSCQDGTGKAVAKKYITGKKVKKWPVSFNGPATISFLLVV